MIPGLPELPFPNIAAGSDRGPFDIGAEAWTSPHAPTGEAPAFDDLIAAALTPLLPPLPSVIVGGEATVGAMIEADLRVSPGTQLPLDGRDMPDVEAPREVLDSDSTAAPRRAVPVSAIVPELERLKEFETEGRRPKSQQPVASPKAEAREPDPVQAIPSQILEDRSEAPSGTGDRPEREPQVAKRRVDANEAVADRRPPPQDIHIRAAPEPAQHLRSDRPVPDDQQTLPALKNAPKEPDSSGKIEPGLRVPPQLKRSERPAVAAIASAASTSPQFESVPTSQSTPAPAPQSPQSVASSSIQASANPLSPVPEVRADARIVPQIEQAIDALTEAREAGRTSRPEMLLRHGEFGLVSMRLDASSGDLRASLASRDPGFVPAIQAALGERAIAASNETSSGHNQQRGQEQAQTGANSQAFAGNGSGFGSNYGSSTGSPQGSSQPRMAQQEETQNGSGELDSNALQEQPVPNAQGGGVFA
ncbi:MAG: hypothetical protein QNJ15_05940 [Erythrobacter sp.]|nr:hypothetical protein [Erythrobacter sp.]